MASICCVECDSPYCDGCNIYHLSVMLQKGKLNGIMDEHKGINPVTEVKPVVHGKWMPHKTRSGKNWWECSVCDFVSEHKAHHYYCPKCGARMEATP